MQWRKQYPPRKTIIFERNEEFFHDDVAGCPSTKPARCLVHELGLNPIPELFRYEMQLTEEAKEKARRFQEEELGNQRYAILHYSGTASKEDKDLTDYEALQLCKGLLNDGLIPVILDWEDNPLILDPDIGDFIVIPDKRHSWLWDGQRHGNAQTITALIDGAEMFLGIDSGPAHLAAATATPAVVFWHTFHPLTNFDLADNVTHVVPSWSKDEYEDRAVAFFEEHYQYVYYDGELGEKIEDVAANLFEEESDPVENVPDDPK